MIWKRYRLYTRSINDYRPLIFDDRYPWWCSGYSDFEAVIIAYLPDGEDVLKYWDDARIDVVQDRNSITFTDRFPKPNWYKEV